MRGRAPVFLTLGLAAWIILAQPPAHRDSSLKAMLGLTDSQVLQIERSGRAQSDVPLRVGLLNAAQRARLRAVSKVLDRWQAASLAISLGLMDARQWPGANLCYYPARVYGQELDLSESQVRDFERLAERNGKPRRDAAWALLNDAQKAKLAGLEAALDLARQAVELGLVPDRRGGEPLCA